MQEAQNYAPVNALPSITEFIQSCTVLDEYPEYSPDSGDFLKKDSPKNQLNLSVDLTKLDARQRAFINLYASGKHSGAEAARLAGYSEKNAAATANRLKKEHAPEIAELMEAAGLSVPALLKVVKDTTECKVAKWNPSKEKFQLFPDNPTRLNAAKTGLQALGVLEQDASKKPTVIVLNTGKCSDGTTLERPPINMEVQQPESVLDGGS